MCEKHFQMNPEKNECVFNKLRTQFNSRGASGDLNSHHRIQVPSANHCTIRPYTTILPKFIQFFLIRAVMQFLNRDYRIMPLESSGGSRLIHYRNYKKNYHFLYLLS